jgi:transposase InsO family protein
LTDHPQLPVELQHEVQTLVTTTKQRSGWPARRTLAALEVVPGSYYRWLSSGASGGGAGNQSPNPACREGSLYEVLPKERKAIMDYALKHPEVRHRELAWRMLDEEVCAVSSSTVYRVLREANLVCRWKPRERRKGGGQPAAPTGPDQLWQTDIRYTKVGGRNYYLLSFLDAYSRYVVHHELLTSMDGLSVSIAAAAAIETLPEGLSAETQAGVRPVVQSDHGSGFIAGEFAKTLAGCGVGHTLIRPHTPTDNGLIERYHRTIGERIAEHELKDFSSAKAVIAEIIEHYNQVRLHSSLNFLRPVDYYRGNPETLLAQRRRKLQEARELRKQENLKLRQRLIPWTPEEHSYSKKQVVSL